jgi:nitrogen regulatory protein PII
VKYFNETKLITAVLPKGVSLHVIKMLKQEKHLTTANFNYARGLGKLTPAKYRGVGEQSEKEMLTVVIDKERADDIFEYIYEVAEVNRPHGGLIHMQKLIQSTDFVLPETVEEEEG